MTAFFKELFGRYSAHRVSRSAAELSYYLLFALFPLLIFISAVLGRLNVRESDLFGRMAFVFPQGVRSLISDYLSYARLGSEENKAFFTYAGSVLAFYMLFRAVTSLNHAVSIAVDVPRARKGAKAAASLLISFALLGFMALTLVILSISESLYGYIGELTGADLRLPVGIIRYAVGPAAVFLVLWFYFYYISEKKYPLRGCAAGAAISAALWYFSSILFAAYFDGFVDIGLLYGSLGSFILLLLWIHLTGTVIILGSEITAVLNAKKA